MRLLIFILTILSVSCASQNKLIKAGALHINVKFYDTLTRQYSNETIFPDMNVWYKNELVIEEIKTAETYQDTNGITTRKTPVAHYLFIDRKSKSFYHYSSFSDTARILEKYTLPDTETPRGVGGWAFYKNSDIEVIGDLKVLTDTVVNNISYKRAEIPVKSNTFSVTLIAYQRCELVGTVFQLDKGLSTKLGCPVTRIDYLPSASDPLPISSEISFLRDSLTVKELRVFTAWEKNLKRYPAK